jgi:hypothetical protein
MTKTLPALGPGLASSDDTMANAAEILPVRGNTDLCGKEVFDNTPQTAKTAAPTLGRGRPTGPGLRVLLTRNFPGGATAEMLTRAGFRGDLAAALKRGDINEQGGCYAWTAVTNPEATNITES